MDIWKKNKKIWKIYCQIKEISNNIEIEIGCILYIIFLHTGTERNDCIAFVANRLIGVSNVPRKNNLDSKNAMERASR